MSKLAGKPAKPTRAATPWKSYELQVGEKTPFAGELADFDTVALGAALRRMVQTQEAGIPGKDEHFPYEFADDKKPRIYRLKIKAANNPRLYVYADPQAGSLIYLHAVRKDQGKRDPKDSQKARRLLRLFLEGEAELRTLDLPT